MFSFDLKNIYVIDKIKRYLHSIRLGMFDEFDIFVDGNGVLINAIDSEHKIYTELMLKSELFHKFCCTKPERLRIHICELDKYIPKDYFIRVKYNHGDRNIVLTFVKEAIKTFEDVCTHKTELQESSNYINCNTNFKPISDNDLVIDNLIHFDFRLTDFKNMLMPFSDTFITLSVNHKNFEIFEPDNEDRNGIYVGFPINPPHHINVSSVFDVQLFEALLYNKNFSDNVIFGIGDDLPLTVELKDNNMMMKFVIAPMLNLKE